ncbi:LuxR family transcriptional regulator [Adlercreutzia muris]|nr:helix-turn-helix transcriptional regulator [Enterorhabdus sp.]NCA31855.1 LuxR family transcriptional regulator [Adlercreutzia muris]
MVRDAIGAAAPLAWSATVLVAAGAGTLVLGRLWRERAMEREAMRMRLLVLQPDRDRLRDEELGCAPTHDGKRSGGVEASGPAYDECGLTARCAWAARAFDLTRREEDVLMLLASGRTASEVAGELVVSSNTVKTHIRNLYRKLGINRRGDLAERLGL